MRDRCGRIVQGFIPVGKNYIYVIDRYCVVEVAQLDELFDHIEKNSRKYVEDLKAICSHQSVSTYKETHRGKVAECADNLVRMMNRIGIKTTVSSIEEGNPIILGELESGKSGAKTLLLYNHYDVQPVEPLDEWNSDPFVPIEKDGKIYARGVADNKGTLVARLAAVKSILEVMGNIPTNLKFLIEGEEEIGSPSLPVFVKANKERLRADGCLWEGSERDTSGRLVVRLGNKGMLYVELSAQGPKSDQHSKWAPVVPNPAWRLCLTLSSLKDAKERILIKGFYDDVREPTQKEVELLKEIPFNEKEYREILGLSKFLGREKGYKLVKRLVFSPTCNIAGFHSGYGGPGSKTVLPSKAVAKVDIRLVPNQKPSKIFQLLRKHLAKSGFDDVKLEVLNQLEPARSSPDSHIVDVTFRCAREVYGSNPVIYPNATGSGPVYTAINILKIPTAEVSGVSRNDSNIHGPNENILLDDFIHGMKLAARIFSTF